MTQPLVIVGAGGFGREVLDVVEAMDAECARFDFLGFLVDGPTEDEALNRRGANVLGGTDLLATIDAAYVIGIGDGKVRCHFDAIATASGLRAATLVHPAATIGADVVLG